MSSPAIAALDARSDQGADVRLDELESLFRSLPVAMCVVDRELRYVRANQLFCEIVGRSIDDVLGREMREVVHPRAREQAIAVARRVLETGAAESGIQLASETPDPHSRPVVWHVNVQPLRDAQQVVGAVAVLQDITYLKELERVAQEQFQELESVYRNAPVGLAFLDQDLRYVRVNEWVAREHGMSVDEMIGKRPDEVVPQTPSAQRRVLRDLVYGPRRVRNLQVRMHPPREPDVEHVYVMSYAPVKDADGRPLGLVASIHDVTGRVRAEAEAREARLAAESRLREIETIYSHAPVGLAFLDEHLRVVRANGLVAQALGDERLDLAGKTVAEIAPDLAGQVTSLCRRGLQSGEPALQVEVSGRAHRRQRRDRTWLVNLHPVPNGSGVAGLVAVAQDITELKRHQQMLEDLGGRLEEAQRLARMGSWEWDLIADTVWWSDELFALYGVDPEHFEPSWNAFFDLVHPADRPAVRRQLEQLLRRDEPSWVEFRVVLPATFEERMIRCAARLERTPNGQPGRLVGTCQDITPFARARRGAGAPAEGR